MIELRDYQQKALDDITQAALEGKRKILLTMPTGSGKSLIALAIAVHAMQKGKRSLIWAPRREICWQMGGILKSVGIDYGLILADEPHDPTLPIQIASIQSLYVKGLKRKTIDMPKADVVIADECFPKGTNIEGRPIEKIKQGDSISSFNHKKNKIEKKKVIKVFSRKYYGDWYKLKTSHGEIVCTSGHPFFLKGYGYVPAEYLRNYGEYAKLITNELPTVREVYNPSSARIKNISCEILRPSMQWREHTRKGLGAATSKIKMHELQKTCYARGEKKISKLCSDRPGVLLSRMQDGGFKTKIFSSNEKNKFKISRPDYKKNDIKKSNERYGSEKKSKPNFNKNWTPAENKGGEWAADPFATGKTIKNIGVGNGICSKNENGKKIRLPTCIQNRYRRPNKENSHRSRWLLPRFSNKKKPRSEKTRIIRIIGLESIEIYKSGSQRRPGWVPKNNKVYNLSVEKNNNFFANGILVHNCHHGLSDSWQRVFGGYPDAFHIGLTATPVNKSGAGLGNFYDSLIHGPSISELTDRGFLAPVKYYVPSIPDLTNLKIRAGDYVDKDLTLRMDRPKLIGDIIENWSRICPKAKTVVSACGVSHSQHIANSFNEIGVKAAHLDGRTPDRERDRVVAQYQANDIQVLCNADLFSEGVDFPDIECLIFARPTKSLGRFIQVAGRGLRPKGGKPLILIDHGAAVYEHGTLDQDFNWQLDYGKKKTINKSMRKQKEEHLKHWITCAKCAQFFTNTIQCPECGTIITLKGLPVETFEAYLQELVSEEKHKYTTTDKALWWQAFKFEAMKKPDYKRARDGHPARAYGLYQEKFKCWPRGFNKELPAQEGPLDVLAWIKHSKIKWAMRNNGKRELGQIQLEALSLQHVHSLQNSGNQPGRNAVPEIIDRK